MKKAPRIEIATAAEHGEAARAAAAFLLALARRPDCQAPVGRNGKPQRWSSGRGFHDADERGAAMPPGRAPVPLTALTAEASRARREAFERAERESRARRANRVAAAKQHAASVADTDRLCRAAATRIEAPFTAGGTLLRLGLLR